MPLNHFLPLVGNDSVGQRTAFGTWLPPGSRVAAYVGPQSESSDAYSASSLLVSTLAAGLARCRSGKGDVVVVLPGHTETVSTTTMLSGLVAGTQILGAAAPNESLMPTFTFSGTTNTSTWTVAVNDVTMRGLKFNLDGADSIDTPLVVTGTGFTFSNNLVNCGSSTSLDADTVLTISTGADNCMVTGNRFFSTSTAVTTTVISIAAAVQAPTISGNDFDVSISGATTGVISISAGATQVRISGNTIVNRRATAAVCISFTDSVGLAGVIADNDLVVIPDVTVIGGLILAAASTNHAMRSFRNFGHDENIGTGVTTGIGTGTIE